MADWADEEAFTLMPPPIRTLFRRRISAALRQARLDALEEAAKYRGDGVIVSFGTHYISENAIRSLKEKQP